MRIGLCVALALLGLSLALSCNAQATKIAIVEEHVSIEAPPAWSVERNSTLGGLVYDLYMEGPSTGTGVIPPSALFDGSYWSGTVSSGTLYEEMLREIEEMESDADISGVVLVSAPTNTTQAGQKANDCTMRASVSGISMTARLIIMASDAWNRVWKLGLFDETADWATSQRAFNLIVNSITVEEKEPSDFGLVLIISAVVAAVVIIVVVVLLMKRKKEPVMAPIMPPPDFQQPPPPPPPT